MSETSSEINLGGRPSIYSPELRNAICTRLAEGETLRSVCRDDDMPSRQTIIHWNINNIGEIKDEKGSVIEEGFSYHYARARDMGLDVMADEILEIADDGTNDWMEIETQRSGTKIVLDKEAVMRSKLRTDTRVWYLSKLAPKRYGAERTLRHQQLDENGEATAPVAPVVNVATKEIMDSVHAELKKVIKNDAENSA